MTRETGVLSHTKDSKMVPDTFLLNTQLYKVRIKGEVKKSWEKELRPPYISV